MKKHFLGNFRGAAKSIFSVNMDNFVAASCFHDKQLQKHTSAPNRMSMLFGLLMFSSANIKLSEITQSPLSTNVAGIILVMLGSTAQTFLVSNCSIMILRPVTMYN
jgi:hypothetical protein